MYGEQATLIIFLSKSSGTGINVKGFEPNHCTWQRCILFSCSDKSILNLCAPQSETNADEKVN
jgi:hypothetical protein